MERRILWREIRQKQRRRKMIYSKPGGGVMGRNEWRTERR
jgi:hypothetical protein